jgi:hypothetical protein
MVEGYSCEARKTRGLSCKTTRAARVDCYRPGQIGSSPSDLDPTARPARTPASGGEPAGARSISACASRFGTRVELKRRGRREPVIPGNGDGGGVAEATRSTAERTTAAAEPLASARGRCGHVDIKRLHRRLPHLATEVQDCFLTTRRRRRRS